MSDAYTSQPEKNETRAEAEKVEQPQSAKFWLNELSMKDGSSVDRPS
jgi:hypothetical protein